MLPALPPAITSRSNARVKGLRQSLHGEARNPGDLLGLEGWNSIHEAHSAGLSFETIFVREGSEEQLEEPGREALRARSWALLSRDVFDSAVSTATPQGVAATWLIQQPVPSRQEANVLVLEGIQDPGNLGTLLRSAFAFGVATLMVTPDTVNHWNPKVVRAAAGAVFRVPVERLPMPEILGRLRGRGVRTVAAVAHAESSSEGGAPEATAYPTVHVGKGESADADSPRLHGPPSGDREEHHAAGFPAVSTSYRADLTPPCALLIGNEGAGLSKQARLLADAQVRIPSQGESLNAAVAGSILMYEAMRQGILRAGAQHPGPRP